MTEFEILPNSRKSLKCLVSRVCKLVLWFHLNIFYNCHEVTHVSYLYNYLAVSVPCLKTWDKNVTTFSHKVWSQPPQYLCLICCLQQNVCSALTNPVNLRSNMRSVLDQWIRLPFYVWHSTSYKCVRTKFPGRNHLLVWCNFLFCIKLNF